MHNAGLGSWPRRRRIKSAGQPAIVAGEATITYDELAERVDLVAAALQQRGVRHGDRVAYLGENHPDFLVTLFAAGLLGAVFVPINTRLAPPEARFILQDCGATLLVHADELTGTAAKAVDGTDVTTRIVIPRADGTSETTDADHPGTVVERLDTLVSGVTPAVLDDAVTLEDPALILYTSGTTGRPKGAVLTHGNITWNCLNVLVDYDLTSAAVALMVSPMFHVASLAMGTLPVILKGGCVVLETKFDPGQSLELIERHRITMLSGVPITFQMMADHPRWETTDLSSLHTLTCGGSAITRRLVEAYQQRGLDFTCGYGMTETSPGATSLPARFSAERIGSSGLPHFFTDVRVVEPAGSQAASGEVGEILVHGPNVMAGYWGRPEATADTMTEDGWLHTGDMGYQDDGGFLFVTDRLKDMFISGGENVYPVEVEAAILELPEVASVAVIGVPDERWGEVPHAFVTPRPGATVDAQTVQQHLAGRLARYKTPRTVDVVEQMPTTATGKIRKDQLRSMYARAQDRGQR